MSSESKHKKGLSKTMATGKQIAGNCPNFIMNAGTLSEPILNPWHIIDARNQCAFVVVTHPSPEKRSSAQLTRRTSIFQSIHCRVFPGRKKIRNETNFAQYRISFAA